MDEESEESVEGEAESESGPAFTLIENKETEGSEEEIFGLGEITRSVEMSEEAEAIVSDTEESETEKESLTEEESGTQEESEAAEETEPIEENLPREDFIKEDKPIIETHEEIYETAEYEDEVLSGSDINTAEENELEEEVEIEINKRRSEAIQEVSEEIKNGTVTSDVYYRFENKFFEEVKILEKFFSYAEKECKGKNLEKLSERALQSFTEIIEISNELSNLAKQLQLDLISDVFLTIELLFTKSIETPSLIDPERVRLLNSSLSLVTSLIKGQDYLEYDEVVNKIEDLKAELTNPPEMMVKKAPEEEPVEVIKKIKEEEKAEIESARERAAIIETGGEEPLKEAIEKQEAKGEDVKPVTGADTSLFKMKYLVKEFEKDFQNLSNIEGEFVRFEILDHIDTLNSLLRMLAKVSASVNNEDVLRLSEVSYVFLKYLKDYRMDLLDTEIQQIIKYIIFTYKMLLTGRKPEDFEILVQYLNNPVKIFTDT